MANREEVIEGLKKVWNAFDTMEHELYADYVFDALELLKEHPAKDTNVPSKWISVKDRLPKPGMSVIIYGTPNEDPEHTDGKIAITYMSEWNYFNSHIKTKPYWIMPWQYFSFDYTITHWMPLPEPPEEVKQDGEA